jgi:N-acetylmuramoyl-L-alanine amidase
MAPAPPPEHAAAVPAPEERTAVAHETAPAKLHDAAPASTRDATSTASHTDASSGPLYTASGDPPTSDGSRSLTRVLGLKIHRIVLDAGHGGHDTGTIGPGNLYEKDVVLDVTRRLGRLLHDRLGVDVIYTRKTDVFIPLQERTAIANRANADLFLSIHANSSDDHSVRGIETYYLDFTKNPRALAVAARENATGELSSHSLQTLIQRIALNDKQQESREFAGDLLTNLVRATHVEDRGVKSAPFVVLIGARMPSVLAEISFLSDPTDARLLRKGAYRERIALALYNGVKRYLESLNGVQAVATEQRSQPVHGHLRTVADRTH